MNKTEIIYNARPVFMEAYAKCLGNYALLGWKGCVVMTGSVVANRCWDTVWPATASLLSDMSLSTATSLLACDQILELVPDNAPDSCEDMVEAA